MVPSTSRLHAFAGGSEVDHCCFGVGVVMGRSGRDLRFCQGIQRVKK